ncbi:MAG TPA: OB-fold domain-containing protein [Dehalococcoidia bacterium]|nr:OB-fold domain-containing protein [Dehalococcoidia bacterium]
MAEWVAKPPDPTPETEPFWEAAQAGRLSVQRCASCHRFRWYPRPMCPFCQSLDQEWVTVSGRGTIYSYVAVHQAVRPDLQDKVPYYPVLVDLDDAPGVRLPSRLIEYRPDQVNDVPIGLPVEVAFRDVEGWLMPFFRPVQAGT